MKEKNCKFLGLPGTAGEQGIKKETVLTQGEYIKGVRSSEERE